jgi:Protein of unknown function (DUF2510)
VVIGSPRLGWQERWGEPGHALRKVASMNSDPSAAVTDDAYTGAGTCRRCGKPVMPSARGMHPRYCTGPERGGRVPAAPDSPTTIDAPPTDTSMLPAPVAPAGWHPDPNGMPQLRYWDGASWTGHTSPLATPPPLTQYGGAWPVPVSASSAPATWRTPSADDNLVRRLAEYTRWSGIAWIILGALQILGVVTIVAGAWNIYAGYTRIRASGPISQRSPGVPAAFQPLAGYVIIGLLNLLLGGVIGVVLVIVDLFVRDQILKNAHIFAGPRAVEGVPVH